MSESLTQKAAEDLVLRLSDEAQENKKCSSFIGDLTDDSDLIAGQVAGSRVQFNGFDIRWLERGMGYGDGERLEIRHDDDQLYFDSVTARMRGPLADIFDPHWRGSEIEDMDWDDEEDDEE